VRTGGFTLLEVMVAIAILAIALTSLLSSQSQSMLAADESEFSIATAFLAEKKMAELLAEGTDLPETSGDFGESHPQYLWRAEIVDADFFDNELLQGTEPFLKRIDLVVYNESERRSFALSRYVLQGAGP
jgi:general secretion pathway protein I